MAEPESQRASEKTLRRVGQQPGQRRARDVVSKQAFVLLESAPVARAAALMAYQHVHHVVAISEQGKVVGMLSALDITRWVAEAEGFSLSDK